MTQVPEETAEQYSLARIDGADRMLMEASTVEEVKDIRDKAEAIRVYLGQQKGGLRIQNRAAYLKIKAERKLGNLLAESVSAGRPKQTQDGLISKPSLSEMGIDDHQSSRWQTEAKVPDIDLEKMRVKADETNQELTSVGVYMLGRRMQEPEPAKTPDLPEGKFACIVIDPPWPMQKVERTERPNQGKALDYPIMSLEAIQALPVSYMAAEDTHVFLWTTHKFLPDALNILDGWGARYVCTFVWHKPGGFQPQGLPQYNCEFVLYGRIGNPTFQDTKDFSTCFNGERHGHSVKPDEFYAMLARVCAGPRLDMFARQQREDFEVWGNEV